MGEPAWRLPGGLVSLVVSCWRLPVRRQSSGAMTSLIAVRTMVSSRRVCGWPSLPQSGNPARCSGSLGADWYTVPVLGPSIRVVTPAAADPGVGHGTAGPSVASGIGILLVPAPG
jgi:hypothetical protein